MCKTPFLNMDLAYLGTMMQQAHKFLGRLAISSQQWGDVSSESASSRLHNLVKKEQRRKNNVACPRYAAH